jgi:hypothetical protein
MFFSRRKAIALFGISAASIAAATTPNPSAAQASTGELDSPLRRVHNTFLAMARWCSGNRVCAPGPAPNSLHRRSSRAWAELVRPDRVSRNPTYLGGVLDKDAVCNGVIFPVTSEEFATYNEREVGYQPTKSHPSRITMLDGSHSAPADHQGEGAPFAQGNLRQTNPSLLSCPARPLGPLGRGHPEDL